MTDQSAAPEVLPNLGRYVPLPVTHANRFWDAVKGLRLDSDPCPDLVAPAAVDAWVNARINYELDPSQWKPPAETLQSGVGDCKDYAVLKRAILLAKGWLEGELFLVTGKDLVKGVEHAVLWTGAGVMDILADPFGGLSDPAELAEVFTPDFAYTEAQAFLYGVRA